MYLREQVDAPDEVRWCASVLNWPGPVGLGPTRDEARAALEANLHAIATERRAEGKAMPRPGTGLPIEFASTTSVHEDAELLSEFILKALGFGPDDFVFFSDESTIGDFGDDERVAEIRENIQEHFGVKVEEPEPVLIVDVLERIRERRASRQ
jgi:predicted RNase H-like HicB family nuclease